MILQQHQRYCPRCGYAVPIAAEFCPHCGAVQPVSTPADPRPVASAQVVTHQPYNESPLPGLLTSTKLYFKDMLRIDKRLGRADFWWGALGVTLIELVILGLLFLLAGGQAVYDYTATLSLGNLLLLFLEASYYVAFTIITTTAMIRRFHDSNLNGAYWLLIFIPGVGPIVILYLLCRASRSVNNHYPLD